MNNVKSFGLVAVTALSLTGCATVKTPVAGSIYTDVKSPMAVTSNANSSKVGTAKATSILGLIATGDASIESAAKNGGINKIHHVDEHATNILGIYAKYEVSVYGE